MAIIRKGFNSKGEKRKYLLPDRYEEARAFPQIELPAGTRIARVKIDVNYVFPGDGKIVRKPESIIVPRFDQRESDSFLLRLAEEAVVKSVENAFPAHIPIGAVVEYSHPYDKDQW